jgi:hypothetical protein
VQPGATDGSQTEVKGAPFAEGALVITRASSGVSTAAKAATSSGTGNPLMPTPRGPGGPGGPR